MDVKITEDTFCRITGIPLYEGEHVFNAKAVGDAYVGDHYSVRVAISSEAGAIVLKDE